MLSEDFDKPLHLGHAASNRVVEERVLPNGLVLEKSELYGALGPYVDKLWSANNELHRLLIRSNTSSEARYELYSYLERIERYSIFEDYVLHPLEKAVQSEALNTFKRILTPLNEQRTGVSALKCLFYLAHGKIDKLPDDLRPGFLVEFYHLSKAIQGHSDVYCVGGQVKRGIPANLKAKGREVGIHRSKVLDVMAAQMRERMKLYKSGLDTEVIERRAANRARILDYFSGSDDDWMDYRWQIKHVTRTPKPLLDLLDISPARKAAIEHAADARIPIGITPYYLSLMDRDRSIGLDHAIRAQVLPPPSYVEAMADLKAERHLHFDFMGEQDTSPINLVTRRYPMIAIVKPYNTCAQICVYCQRNWEIDECLMADAFAPRHAINEALDWIANHEALGDVLITGGDPAVMTDAQIDAILARLAEMKHVYRIRIGTRMPVVLPFRITDDFVATLFRYRIPGVREIALMTHFEHSYEITPEARDAINRLKLAGIGVYNQQVFTVENSRRFETAKLRLDLRKIGIDPYYTFNMKGKRELSDYIVPIARLIQEREEEARLLPGLDRTDVAVFNVPKLGKNDLMAGQDHRLIMIKPDGSRVYEFHPWEKGITLAPPFKYTDVPIYDYLLALQARGEDPADYRSIWYYY